MKRIKILEIIILIVIIISIGVICEVSKIILSTPIEESTSSEVTDYKKTKVYEYSISLDDISSYPNSDYIDLDNSNILVDITSTDNYIQGYKETIVIKYNLPSSDYKNSLINYCNSYNEIEYAYQFTCEYSDIYTLNIINNYELGNDSIKEVEAPVSYNYRLDLYLSELDSKNIKYKQVS